MKFLKVLLGIIVFIVLAFLILAAFAPSKMVLSESKVINASPDIIYNVVNDLSARGQWDPWSNMDPSMTTTFESDNTSGVGAKYSWSGEQVGTGSQEILEVKENEYIKSKLLFEGFDGENFAEWNFESAEGGTKTTWSFDGAESGYPMKIFNMLMKGQLSESYKTGLDNLAKVCESGDYSSDSSGKTSGSAAAFEIETIDMGERYFVINRADVLKTEISQFYQDNLPMLFTATQTGGYTPAGQPCGIYYEWLEESETTDMAAAVPVQEIDANIEGYETVSLGGKALKIAYYGPYDEIGKAHDAMGMFCESNEVQMNGPAIEEYITDPTTVNDPSEILTNVYYLIQ